MPHGKPVMLPPNSKPLVRQAAQKTLQPPIIPDELHQFLVSLDAFKKTVDALHDCEKQVAELKTSLNMAQLMRDKNEHKKRVYKTWSKVPDEEVEGFTIEDFRPAVEKTADRKSSKAAKIHQLLAQAAPELSDESQIVLVEKILSVK